MNIHKFDITKTINSTQFGSRSTMLKYKIDLNSEVPHPSIWSEIKLIDLTSFRTGEIGINFISKEITFKNNSRLMPRESNIIWYKVTIKDSKAFIKLLVDMPKAFSIKETVEAGLISLSTLSEDDASLNSPGPTKTLVGQKEDPIQEIANKIQDIKWILLSVRNSGFDKSMEHEKSLDRLKTMGYSFSIIHNEAKLSIANINKVQIAYPDFGSCFIGDLIKVMPDERRPNHTLIVIKAGEGLKFKVTALYSLAKFIYCYCHHVSSVNDETCLNVYTEDKVLTHADGLLSDSDVGNIINWIKSDVNNKIISEEKIARYFGELILNTDGSDSSIAIDQAKIVIGGINYEIYKYMTKESNSIINVVLKIPPQLQSPVETANFTIDTLSGEVSSNGAPFGNQLLGISTKIFSREDLDGGEDNSAVTFIVNIPDKNLNIFKLKEKAKTSIEFSNPTIIRLANGNFSLYHGVFSRSMNGGRLKKIRLPNISTELFHETKSELMGIFKVIAIFPSAIATEPQTYDSAIFTIDRKQGKVDFAGTNGMNSGTIINTFFVKDLGDDAIGTLEFEIKIDPTVTLDNWENTAAGKTINQFWAGTLANHDTGSENNIKVIKESGVNIIVTDHHDADMPTDKSNNPTIKEQMSAILNHMFAPSKETESIDMQELKAGSKILDDAMKTMHEKVSENKIAEETKSVEPLYSKETIFITYNNDENSYYSLNVTKKTVALKLYLGADCVFIPINSKDKNATCLTVNPEHDAFTVGIVSEPREYKIGKQSYKYAFDIFGLTRDINMFRERVLAVKDTGTLETDKGNGLFVSIDLFTAGGYEE